jgi:hypothetical protein
MKYKQKAVTGVKKNITQLDYSNDHTSYAESEGGVQRDDYLLKLIMDEFDIKIMLVK